MPRTCTYDWNGKSAKASWTLEEDSLLLMPEGGAPLPFAVKEFSGIAGDGYTLELLVPGGLLKLTKLGQDGPTLLDQLKRTWPLLRADALRLRGTGEPARYTCRASSPAGARASVALLYEDILLLAPEGADLTPVLLPTITGVEFDEETYAVALELRAAAPAVLTKLAGQTQEVLDKVKAARGRLTEESLKVLSAWMPALSALQKAALAGAWPPGLLLSFRELEELCPGFAGAFEKGWLSQALRKEEGRALIGDTDRADLYLGFARPPADMAQPAPGEEDSSPEASEGETVAAAEAPTQQEPILLWLLARRGGSWYLESLTEKDHATYRFEGGEEMRGLCTSLLCCPIFSREALYMALEKLTGERADYAIAARDLEFLRDLRARFKERVIHSGLATWKAKVLK